MWVRVPLDAQTTKLMCLDLSKRQTKPKKTIKVYKWYNLHRHNKNGQSVRVVSPYQFVTIDLDRTTVLRSSRKSTALCAHEKHLTTVNHGLHVFRYKKHAMEWAADGSCANSHTVLVEFEASPKDFVATGAFHGVPSVVYHRLKVRKVLMHFYDGKLVKNSPHTKKF